MQQIKLTWREQLSKAVYSRLISWITPIFKRKLRRRAQQEPIYGEDIAQRFAIYPPSTVVAQPCIWLHAVSLGETRTAAILLQQLRQQYPNLALVLTNGTATGRAAGQELLQSGDVQVWQPWDTEAAATRFFQQFQPKIGLILETEIWPNLISAAQQSAIPLFLINARLSEKSLQSTNRWLSLLAPSYRALTGVIAQSQPDATRLSSLGAKVLGVFGNLKFDLAIDAAQQAVGRYWRERSTKPILMLASSREGEEELLLQELKKLAKSQLEQLRVLVVPRHPQRFAAVAQLFSEQGWQVVRRSEQGLQFPTLAAGADRSILLGDSVGEMASYYSCSSLALLGGSFNPFGGQNLIEACAYSCPVICGPSLFNFNQAAELALQAQAAVAATDMRQALQLAIDLLLQQPQQLQLLQQRAGNFVQQHQGATQRSLAALAPWLPPITDIEINYDK